MSRRSWAFDVALAAVVLVWGQLEAWAGVTATHRQGPPAAEASVYAVTALLLLLRRVNPLGCLAGIGAASLVEYALVGAPEGSGVLLPALVASYSVARWEDRARSWLALPLVGALWFGWAALDPVSQFPRGGWLSIVWLAPWVIAWLVGALVRSTALAADQRRVLREQQASRAVSEERNRIARELHDVIGHSVSVMTVQASAVRRRLTPEQQTEREALETVEAVGREALTEMRRMVGVLRDAGAETDREPAPGLDQVDRLAAHFRAAGLPVEVTVSGREPHLPPGLDLTAYRLLQEGLTNALRHALSPTRAEVTIDYRDDSLELAVRDDGRPSPARAEAGHGLLGMRERVSVYGGRLVARPLATGGFELVATLPVGQHDEAWEGA